MSTPKDPVSEIERLLDELESFAEKSPWWMGNKIAVRDEDFFRITQRMRELLPTELAEARRMLERRDLILKNAQDEHRRIIDSAERRLDDLVSDEQVVVVARQAAERIVEQARLEGESVKRDALQYTMELLEEMEREFARTLTSLRKGRQFLQDEIGQRVDENMAAVSDLTPVASEDEPGASGAGE